MASPMRLAGRYFIAFPLKAAYQGWLDEASSDLIPAYRPRLSGSWGASVDGPEAEQTAECYRKAMQHSRAT